jgi:TonB-linked SusC/RagA family outer membrane protein
MKRLLTVLLCLLPVFAWSQNTRVIKGKVLSAADGESLIGASVYIDKSTIGAESGIKGVIENMTLGTITDLDGKFSFEVPKGLKTIMCSFLGFEAQSVNIQGKDFVTIKLGESTSSLGEVVVTGYQKIEKRKVTSAVVKVNADNIRQAGIASVDHMLSGQLAGVTTMPTSGAPGAPAKIRIRGTASLSGTQDPLWVVDGVPLDGNDLPNFNDKDNIDQLYNSSIAGLNPQDIANITILKDAAATAIYGARAANGVIVIATKKGKKGKMNVSFTSNTSFTSRPDLSKLNLMNSNQKVDLELALAARQDLEHRTGKGGVARILDQYGQLNAYRTNGFEGISAEAQADINALRAVNTNWEKELYQTAVNQDHSLSISGGNDFATYYFSAGYHKEKGTTIGTGLDRYNVTLKTNFQLRENLKFGVSMFASQRENKSYLTGTDLFTNPTNYTRTVNPYQKVRDEKGQYVYDQEVNGYSDAYIPFNIIEEREGTSHIMKNRNLNMNFDLDWKLTNELNLRSQLGIQSDNSNTVKEAQENTYYARKEIAKSLRYNSDSKQREPFLPAGGILRNWDNENFSYNLKTMVEYSKTLADIHEVDVMVGNELRETENRRNYSAAYGWYANGMIDSPVIFPKEGDANIEMDLFNRSYVKNRYVSFFGTASYTYNRKYTLFGSVRYDGSNLFGTDPEYKYMPLWAFSGAWRASEEDILKNIEWLSNLKFRASYGLQGNIDRDTYPVIVGKYKQSSILPGYEERSIEVLSPPNAKLRWEKTRTYNFGGDLALFRHAVRLSFDYYDRNSTDLIGMKAIPLENGFEFTNVNWAEVSNKGWEMSIATRNIKTDNFEWNTNFNIAHNKNRVEKVEVSDSQLTPSLEGYPVNAVFVIKTAGMDENGYPLFWKDGEKVNGQEFFKLYDAWADFYPGYMSESKLTNEDIRGLFSYAGDADPKYSGGIINTFKYKNFDLAVSCNFNLGMKRLASPKYHITNYDRGLNGTTDLLDVINGDKKNYPNLMGPQSGEGNYWMEYAWNYLKDPVNSYRYLDIWLKEVNYMRISSIRLGYSLPQSLTQKVNLKSVRFSFEARNPFVISSDYDGYFDPESYGNIYAQPQPKSYTLGLNVTF